jgi:hypothetical protein
VGIHDVVELPFYAEHGVRSCFVWGAMSRHSCQPLIDEALAGFHSEWRAVEGY